MMKSSTIKYYFIESVKSIRRNRTLSLASVATVAASLFILGVFMLLIINTNQVLSQVGSKLQVQVFLTDEVTKDQMNDIKKVLEGCEGVTDIEFQDKEQALQNAKNMFEDKKDLAAGFEKNNPFPMSYIVSVSKAEVVTSVSEGAKSLPGVKKVRDVRDIANKIERVSNGVKWFGIVIFIVLLVASIFLIGNTIKLAVFSRRREIGIMKYVGATDWFIRWPFIIEGMIIGFLGSIFSTVVIYYVYKLIYNKLINNMFMIKLVHPSFVLSNVTWQFILAGIVIGSLGSIISIRKFLKV